MNKKNKITFAKAINEALFISMKKDRKVICYGLGINDPKHIFDTTNGLKKYFGSSRVFDFPTSENAMTGLAIGAGLNNYKSVMVHQRFDFFLLAMDQLVNGAAKWHFMFGGKKSVPITIRLIVGRGWGQGPTHSQSLHSWFAHIPGLKVVMPSNASDAKGLLISSIFDKNPVIFIEHRWLHNQLGYVYKDEFKTPLSKCKVVKSGADITIISMSYMTVEAIKVVNFLNTKKINCELIDLRTLSPIDYKTIFKSVKKTGRVIVIDTGHHNLSVAGEIIARITMKLFKNLRSAPERIALPDIPVPSSYALTKNFYPDVYFIAKSIIKVLKLNTDINLLKDRQLYHDIPGPWFKGPF